jgi:predicted chitinase/murein DD-endopeptidase MepM/ murein hydrolase activator NlpD
MTTYAVRSGDTLSILARRFGTTVAALASANNIANPNRIRVGQVLTIPGGSVETRPASQSTQQVVPPVASGAGTARDSNGREFPTSSDGTPLFAQGDAAWRTNTLGQSLTLGAAGCAMTSTAMAISKISGKIINPAQLDAYLDSHGGYTGDALYWDKAAQSVGLHAAKPVWSLDTIHRQLDAGRPVVVGVDYKAGSGGGGNGTDHWIAVTARGVAGGVNVYYANDPATGQQITLRQDGSRMRGGPQNYVTTGELITFSGGNPPRPSTVTVSPATQPAITPVSVTTSPTSPSSTRLIGVTLPAGDLSQGMRGPEVELLQRALVRLGHMTLAELNTGVGIFGPKTEAALKAFQAAHGVDAIGRYGPRTREVFTRLGATIGGASTQTPVTNTPPSTSGTSEVTVEQLRRVMPNLSLAKAQQYLPFLNSAMQEAGINTRLRKAAFLAQLAHESVELRYMEEIASGADYEGRTDLGNTQRGDGTRYKGRGPIQLTGRANYRDAGRALGLDLEGNPTQAATPEVGFRIAAWYWTTRNLNTYADASNFRQITRLINGGYNGQASREAYYRTALSVL